MLDVSKKKEEIVYWGRKLNEKNLVSFKSGNISLKLSGDKILITSHDCFLGDLSEDEIILIDRDGNILEGEFPLTSEKELHINIHKNFNDVKAIIHAHSLYTTAFFNYFDRLEFFSFEARLYLGKVNVLPQDTPIVSNIDAVVKALKDTSIVVLKNHGVVAIGDTLKEAFGLIELLEDQARVNFQMRCGSVISKDRNDQKDEEERIDKREKYKLFSKEHIDRLVELVNNDGEAQELGKRYDLTCTLAVKNQDTGECVCFYYEQGRIIKTDNNENAEFLIIGSEDILKKVFNRQIDPFVASTQGKVKTKGDFYKMSKWYPVLVRTFKLWEQAPVY